MYSTRERYYDSKGILRAPGEPRQALDDGRGQSPRSPVVSELLGRIPGVERAILLYYG